jgi:hypothetical protein
MNKTQAAKFLSYGNLAQFFSSKASVWEDFPILKEEIDNFFLRKSQLMNSTQLGSNSILGVNNAKLAQLTNMHSICLILCDKAFVWAKKTTNHVAMAAFDLTISEFNISQIDQIFLAKNVLALLRQHAEALSPYRISKSDLDAFETSINEAESTLPNTSVAQQGKTGANQSLPVHFAAIDESIDSIQRLIRSEYRLTNPELVNQFLLAKTVERPSTRHTTLRGKISHALSNQDLQGAYCNLLEVHGEESFSDITGFYEIKEFKAGTLTLEVSKEGYETFSQVISIKPGQTKELNIALKPKTV